MPRLRPEGGHRPLSSVYIVSDRFANEYLPVYDVSDAVAVVVEAERETVWDALLQIDLLDVGRRSPMVGVLHRRRPTAGRSRSTSR